MHHASAIKNEIAKAVVNSAKDFDLKSISMPNININRKVSEIKKEFWIGNYKITIKIH